MGNKQCGITKLETMIYRSAGFKPDEGDKDDDDM